jgi:hypothetical protein
MDEMGGDKVDRKHPLVRQGHDSLQRSCLLGGVVLAPLVPVMMTK